MEIPIQEIPEKTESTQRTHRENAWRYLKFLQDTDNIRYFLRNIDESINLDSKGRKYIWVKAIDFAKSMAEQDEYFKDLSLTTIEWGMKFALFVNGIFLSTTRKHTIIDPTTNKPFLMFSLRRVDLNDPDDHLSVNQTKKLPPGFRLEAFSNKVVETTPEEEDTSWFFRSSIDTSKLR